MIRSSPPGAWFVDVGGKELGTCVCVCVCVACSYAMFACLLALTLLPSPKTPSAKRKWRNARTVGHLDFSCLVAGSSLGFSWEDQSVLSVKL